MEISVDILRELCNHNAVNWTEHIALRMLKRGITKWQVLAAVQNGEIFEQYPDDYPYPSCLLLGYDEDGRAIHVVCGLSPDSVWMGS